MPKLLESQLSSFSELKLLFEMLDCSNSLEFFFNPLVVYLFRSVNEFARSEFEVTCLLERGNVQNGRNSEPEFQFNQI